MKYDFAYALFMAKPIGFVVRRSICQLLAFLFDFSAEKGSL